MTAIEYLEKNIDTNLMNQAKAFSKTNNFKEIHNFTRSEEFKKLKETVKKRDKDIHKDTLAQIKYLQDELIKILK
jgi:uncharacterized Fe-S radical SAM superfamily protein PflX